MKTIAQPAVITPTIIGHHLENLFSLSVSVFLNLDFPPRIGAG